MKMAQDIDFEFRKKILNKHISSTISYCYQCTSCTSACPIAEITSGRYNPRKLIINALLGLKEKIFIQKDPSVWDCTQCCTCDEICPQKVKITEILTYIKNQFAEQKIAPEGFLSEARAVYQNGRSVPIQPAIERRREQLGLTKVPEINYAELQDIMKMTGLNKLIEEKKAADKKEGE
jgi:heterodisulfide reductase subunit C